MVRYVNPVGTAFPVDGTTYERGFRSLDDGLDPNVNGALNAGFVELRLAGRHVFKPSRFHYVPQVPATPRTAAFVLHQNLYRITGGWTGMEPFMAEYGSGSPSVLSGDIGVANDQTDNCYHVLIPYPDSDNVEHWVKDVVIQSGFADGPAIHGYGGGILNHGGRLRLAEVVVQDCYAQYGGACASIEFTSPQDITDSQLHARRTKFVSSKASTDGGGIYLRHSGSFFFFNCVVRNNTATQFGGGVMIAPEVHDCIFQNPLIHDNLAEVAGGGVYAADPTGPNDGYWFINGTIAYNSGGDLGGAGVYVEYDSSNSMGPNRLIVNTIIYSNPPAGNNDNLYLAPAPAGFTHSLDVSNSFIGESALTFGTLISGTTGWGLPHIDAALFGYTPGWVNPAGRIFRLLPNSVCINNGSDRLLATDLVDLDLDTDWGTGGERTPLDLYDGAALLPPMANTREMLVPGTGFAPVSIGQDAGNMPGIICDIGAYEYY